MSFEAEWAQFKADAVQHHAPLMRLASTEQSATEGLHPAGVDLGLTDGPIRTKASEIQLANADAKEKSKLDDAAAAGKIHSGWAAGPASNACVSAWQKRLRGLSDVVEDAAAALTKAMDKQISDDVSVAQRLRAQADWLEDA
ncbi:hypothetical protein [Streptomyces zagrosensis]|uniref:Uncharacterized protein n=1 Tax=Streptomyces zagrosensis TaxID=1042984 RepID=A0A7W9Q7F0_9ACTN|nr:hypothetical protein [Streptomyces zagrosensis]MBB5935006.1 hypothetical protein [Streptomyces zagrosensis]